MRPPRRREPLPGLFRLVLPLPFPGLDRVNAYLLTGPEGATLVDCGIFDPSEEGDHGWDALVGSLEVCDVTVADIRRLVITHTHIDHYGMAARMAERSGCEVWMHEAARFDLEFYRDPQETIARLRKTFAEHGVGPPEVEELTAFEDWSPFISGVVDAGTWLEGGEEIAVGTRTWQVVHTPGHSSSHICLWAAEERALISGDHLLASITPHIDFRRGETDDPLREFLSSLDKIEALEPDLVLPGHGRPFDDGAGRAWVIARHHDRRLGSILQVIRHEPRTADEITDAIFGTTLLNFQRRLALGEALAHLIYLMKRGEIERIDREDGTFAFRKVDRRAKDRGDA